MKGGKRDNSGRKKKEVTKVISFRVNEQKSKILKSKIKELINEF